VTVEWIVPIVVAVALVAGIASWFDEAAIVAASQEPAGEFGAGAPGVPPFH
jgi:hypothetical protein